jgi:hypothetical protein
MDSAAARLGMHYAASVSGYVRGRVVDRVNLRPCRRRSLAVMPCKVRPHTRGRVIRIWGSRRLHPMAVIPASAMASCAPAEFCVAAQFPAHRLAIRFPMCGGQAARVACSVAAKGRI